MKTWLLTTGLYALMGYLLFYTDFYSDPYMEWPAVMLIIGGMIHISATLVFGGMELYYYCRDQYYEWRVNRYRRKYEQRYGN